MVRGKPAERNGAAPPEDAASPEGAPLAPAKRLDENKPTELTAEELFALTSQWKRQVTAQRDRVASAKTDYDSEKSTLRDLYKKCKAELGEEGLARVKLLADIEKEPAALDRFRADMQNMIWVAQWTDATEGKQLELMPDLRPTADRAFDDGKKAGLAGEAFNPRYGQGTEAYHRFQDGWQAGQDILARSIKPLETVPSTLGAPETQPDGTPPQTGTT